MGFKRINLEELLEEGIAQERELKKQINLEEDQIVLDGHYYIGRETIKSDADILKWVEHLTEKNWVTTLIINRFVRLAKRWITSSTETKETP